MIDHTVAVDAMGGDHGPTVIVPATGLALANHSNSRAILFGDVSQLEPLSALLPSDVRERLSIMHAPEVVEMDESPSLALRRKKESSMRRALDAVYEGTAQACVSAGNTGALMAMSRFVLKTFPGIDRPALVSEMPVYKRKCRVLDLGANVDCPPEQLLQFALMGSVLVSALDDIEHPTVGLLNIGVEPIKGNAQVKAAAQWLQSNNNLNYVGYVEADQLFSGEVDVIVCDGFVGNVALKATEGIARLFRHHFREEVERSKWSRLSSALVSPMIKRLRNTMDPGRYNGGSFLGIPGTVVKSHGGADQDAFAQAIHEAIKQVTQRVPARIEDRIGQLLAKGQLT